MKTIHVPLNAPFPLPPTNSKVAVSWDAVLRLYRVRSITSTIKLYLTPRIILSNADIRTFPQDVELLGPEYLVMNCTYAIVGHIASLTDDQLHAKPLQRVHIRKELPFDAHAFEFNPQHYQFSSTILSLREDCHVWAVANYNKPTADSPSAVADAVRL